MLAFLSTLSLRRATSNMSNLSSAVSDFYPRSPCGERLHQGSTSVLHSVFLSTLSLRRATQVARIGVNKRRISIHALLAESDVNDRDNVRCHSQFLSTLSLRRATLFGHNVIRAFVNFYPRSPCGERPKAVHDLIGGFDISIHALLAESDLAGSGKADVAIVFLSTLSLRRATSLHGKHKLPFADFYPRSPCGERLPVRHQAPRKLWISIHALLAESDVTTVVVVGPSRDFYPRSPCGERQSFGNSCTQAVPISIHALLAESDNNIHF